MSPRRHRNAHLGSAREDPDGRLLRHPHYPLPVLRTVRRGLPLPGDRNERRVRASRVSAQRSGLHAIGLARKKRSRVLRRAPSRGGHVTTDTWVGIAFAILAILMVGSSLAVVLLPRIV